MMTDCRGERKEEEERKEGEKEKGRHGDEEEFGLGVFCELWMSADFIVGVWFSMVTIAVVLRICCT